MTAPMKLMGMMDSHTVMYGVFGDPIRQSKSPVMMNRAFRETGVNAAYAAFHVAQGRLKEAVAGLRALQFGGVNVTIPHKLEIMSYMDELDESARVIGAVNTVVQRDGKLIGYNTDGIGYVRSLKEETGIDLAGKRIVVLGARGAARALVYALLRENPEMLWIANRTEDVAASLAKSMSAYGNVAAVGLSQVQELLQQSDLLINTTSVGMFPNIDESPVPIDWLGSHLTVSDIVYNPLTTTLLHQASSQGCKIHGGLGMFIYQGAYAFEYWTGLAAPVEAMREAVIQALE